MKEIILTIVLTLFASSGFWTFVLNVITSKQRNDSSERRMMLGLGYAKIHDLCTNYIDRGYITSDEYKDLEKYLYSPYSDMGGNGTCERLMKEVNKLPIKEN